MSIYVGYPRHQAEYTHSIYGRGITPRTRYLSLKKKAAKKNPAGAKAKSQKKNPLGRGGSGNSGSHIDLKDYRLSAHNMSDRAIKTTFNKLKSSRDPLDRRKADILIAEIGVRDSVSRYSNPKKKVTKNKSLSTNARKILHELNYAFRGIEKLTRHEYLWTSEVGSYAKVRSPKKAMEELVDKKLAKYEQDGAAIRLTEAGRKEDGGMIEVSPEEAARAKSWVSEQLFPKKKAAKKKGASKTNSGWKEVPHPEFPRYTWSPSSDVTYTVKRMYGSMFADTHEYVYSVTRKGPRATTDIHQPGIDPKHINKLSDAKAFAEKDFKKKPAKKKATRKTKPGWKILTDRCDKLWDNYNKKPTKKSLNLVFDHLAKMKASTKYEASKRVRDKRTSCLRRANKEARRLKMK